jgi:hypothetical protein
LIFSAEAKSEKYYTMLFAAYCYRKTEYCAAIHFSKDLKYILSNSNSACLPVWQKFTTTGNK